MNAAVIELTAAGVPTVTACALTGRSRATLHRRAARAADAVSCASREPAGSPVPAVGGNAPLVRARRVTRQSLSDTEREHARALLTCPAYAD